MVTLAMVRNGWQAAASSTQLSADERERRAEETRASGRLADVIGQFCEATPTLAAANVEGRSLRVVEWEFSSRVSIHVGDGTVAVCQIDVVQGAKVAGAFPTPRYVLAGQGLAAQEYAETDVMTALWSYLRGELRVRRQPIV